MTPIVKSIKQYPARWIAAAVAVALVAAYFAPLLSTYHPEQDTCSFGPVSNARYRELLAEAKRKQATVWPALVRDDYKARVQLNARVDDLSRDLATVYERLAAMHAILRALGADYRAASPDQDPYERATRMGGLVGFDYHIDINRLGMFAPIRRRGLLIGGIYTGGGETGSPTDTTRYIPGVVSIGALFPKLLETYHFVPRSQFGEVCPPVPKPEQVERFGKQGPPLRYLQEQKK